MKKLLSLLLIFILCLGMTSCGKKEETKTQEEIVNPIRISISISDSENDEVTLEDFEGIEKTEFTVEEDTNVLDATQLFCVSNEIPFELDSAGTYIVSMAGAGEKDVEATTGWVYTVNGEQLNVGSNEKILKDGDEISWEFVDFSTYQW